MGSSGNLCSQLQIFASLVAVAKANNLKIAFSENMIKNHGVGIRIFDLLDLSSEFELKPEEFFSNFRDKHINLSSLANKLLTEYFGNEKSV